MGYLQLFFKGIFLGIGAIAPGLSGGALAMILGVYERLITAISELFTKFKQNSLFLATVGLGAAIGVVIFAGIQRYLLGHFMMETMFVFVGLVLGTLPHLFIEANKFGFKKRYYSGFSVTLGIGIILSFLSDHELNLEATTIELNVQTFIYLFLVGLVLAGSLVIPGISGTVLLVLIGAYGLFINVVADMKDILFIFRSEMDFWHIINQLFLLTPLLLGLLIGAVIYAKAMRYLLNKYYGYTYYAILGFVIGSLFELIPEFTFNRSGLFALICGLIAFVLSLLANQRFADKDK